MEGGGTPYSSSMAPSGSYILIVVSQPVTDEHKQVILERLNKVRGEKRLLSLLSVIGEGHLKEATSLSVERPLAHAHDQDTEQMLFNEGRGSS
ncbi:hypothetical protein NPIL_249751 [Nephila pilipes]|uniref:Uncharacterized protein n=1 Tax=Nephila pilipes TaxID=299642 RepID=A0A8X6TVA0_NEPPI|nr:hypothetical protein NPIL_249751 [Nephila pilipes]